jgi:SAM-dependent methyltransferase
LPESPALRGVDRLHGIPGTFEVAVCGACGSGRTLPHVPSDGLSELYPRDYNAYALPRQPLLRAAATALFRTRYAAALRSEPLRRLRANAGRLLDVGSGRGDLGVVLREHGWDVTALEPSPDACAEAAARGLRAVCGTLETSAGALGDGYDAVVFNHSLEHVVEPLDDLEAARRLLAGGGTVIVSVPNFGSWQRRRFGSCWFHLDLPRHRSHFTPRGLETLLRRAGFAEISVTTSTSADGLPTSLQYRAFGRRRFDHGIGRYAAMAATLAATPVSVALDRTAGGGDILHAAAVNPRG